MSELFSYRCYTETPPQASLWAIWLRDTAVPKIVQLLEEAKYHKLLSHTGEGVSIVRSCSIIFGEQHELQLCPGIEEKVFRSKIHFCFSRWALSRRIRFVLRRNLSRIWDRGSPESRHLCHQGATNPICCRPRERVRQFNWTGGRPCWWPALLQEVSES